MKKIALVTGLVLVVLLTIGVMRGESIIIGMRVSQTQKTDLASLKALLEPNIIVKKPAGEGPFPVIFQFHGCAGARLEFQEMWADIAVKNGYMAVIVDSLRPRGYSREQAVATVCRGKELLGMERTGDVVAAYDLISERDDVDQNNIIFAGWSHGAWTVMDTLTLDFNDSLPPSLSSYEGNKPTVKGAILFYPYCGIGALSRIHKWQQSPNVLALIAGADSIVNHKECLSVFNKVENAGIQIDRTVYTNTEHAFDDPFIESDYRSWHHPENMADAMARYETFLQKIAR